jgi:hypothetical protein
VTTRQHGGLTRYSNLATACTRCNLNKGPNLAGIDPKTRKLVPLFHPRLDRWTDHFRWRGAQLIGSTPIDRVTIRVLAMNDPDAVALRRLLIAEGSLPPQEGSVLRGVSASTHLR